MGFCMDLVDIILLLLSMNVNCMYNDGISCSDLYSLPSHGYINNIYTNTMINNFIIFNIISNNYGLHIRLSGYNTEYYPYWEIILGDIGLNINGNRKIRVRRRSISGYEQIGPDFEIKNTSNILPWNNQYFWITWDNSKFGFFRMGYGNIINNNEILQISYWTWATFSSPMVDDGYLIPNLKYINIWSWNNPTQILIHKYCTRNPTLIPTYMPTNAPILNPTNQPNTFNPTINPTINNTNNIDNIILNNIDNNNELYNELKKSETVVNILIICCSLFLIFIIIGCFIYMKSIGKCGNKKRICKLNLLFDCLYYYKNTRKHVRIKTVVTKEGTNIIDDEIISPNSLNSINSINNTPEMQPKRLIITLNSGKQLFQLKNSINNNGRNTNISNDKQESKSDEHSLSIESGHSCASIHSLPPNKPPPKRPLPQTPTFDEIKNDEHDAIPPPPLNNIQQQNSLQHIIENKKIKAIKRQYNNNNNNSDSDSEYYSSSNENYFDSRALARKSYHKINHSKNNLTIINYDNNISTMNNDGILPQTFQRFKTSRDI